ncbi:DUF4403 family protein [Flavihumibacter profundi]|uniref:DUF4403 family protein n=1 Tax=Flavihumibacter profundi TaxID=2716883 RepID=UPI001CC3CC89|nr:DUF4403 family protein [Flavihumibacter profundi]MBZ5857236.1 DUF4403 family protein [Flavihumibacter profundi]
MHKRKLATFYVLLILVTASCSTSKKTVSAPLPAPVRKSLPPLPESVVNLPVTIAIQPFLLEAEKLAPKEITSAGWPGYLNSGCDFRYKYRFIRSGFRFSCSNNRITVAMNGNYQIAGSKTVCVMNQAISPWVNGSCGFGDEPMRKVNISLVSDLHFTPDYRLRTNTRVDKIQAIDKCLVTFFNNDVTAEILDSISASINAFGKNIDAAISNLRFDNVLEPIGEKSGRKIPLSTYGYLKLNASEVNLGPINFAGGNLDFMAGISCYPEISSDSSNENVSRHLPPLKGNIAGNGFNLSANAIYDYTTIDTLLTRTLRNREFDVKGEKIKIENVMVRGLDNYKVEFRISFTGTKKGTLYLQGSPELDLATQTITVPDLEYDLNSSSITLQIGKTFFNRQILERLRQQAKVNVSELYQKNKTRIDSQFNRTVADGITLKGGTSQLRLNGLVINKDNVQVQANVTGNLALAIAKLPGN